MLGQTISHYKILGRLGSGGMGEVWEAEDLKLGRHVALKFLASHLVSDPETHKRFEREAKAAASLSHPNICHVHEIDEADGKTFLAMELVRGESLEAKIEQGPLPLPEALDLARQVAEGLQEAHAHGVVHRDIKPGNILVTEDGRAKILDFGLAMLSEQSKLTLLDQTVGTVCYMSPEQTQGVGVDHRADIWALGCVLYELVTARRPFLGDYDQALVYSIINESYEPITALRAGVPMELEVFVGKCLEKDPSQRYSDAGELAKDLRSLAEKLRSGRSTIMQTATAVPAAPQAHPLSRYRIIEQRESSAESVIYEAEDSELKRAVAIRVLPSQASREADRKLGLFSRLRLILAAMAAALVLVSSGALWLWLDRSETSQASVRKFSFTPEDLVTQWRGATISPNGKHIVYVAGEDETSLWVRDLDTEEPRRLPGTEGAQWFPFWSPDSRFVGFAAENELKKIEVTGGQPISLCPLASGGFIGGLWGGLWSQDGDTIFYSAFSQASLSAPTLFRVPARGGEPRGLEAESSAKGIGNTVPSMWTGENTDPKMVFELGNPTDHDIYVKDLGTGELEMITEGAIAMYSPTGHLVYQTSPGEGGLWALPFSKDEMRATGEPFPIAQEAGGASVSNDGTLAYVDFGGAARTYRFCWYDRAGQRLDCFGGSDLYPRRPELSPDGRRVSWYSEVNVDAWVSDLELGTTTNLTPAAEIVGRDPIWSPSGSEVAFAVIGPGTREIVVRPANAVREARPIKGVAASRGGMIFDWSPDGRALLFGDEVSIWKADPSGDAEPEAFLESNFLLRSAQFSPDGRYVAYISYETGSWEVYVTSFHDRKFRVTVSDGGGRQPRWSRDGKELFYVTNGHELMAVPVSWAPEPSFGRAKKLFTHLRLSGWVWDYDVHPDGRFLIVEPADAEGSDRKAPSIHVVENWYEEFRDREQD